VWVVNSLPERLKHLARVVLALKVPEASGWDPNRPALYRPIAAPKKPRTPRAISVMPAMTMLGSPAGLSAAVISAIVAPAREASRRRTDRLDRPSLGRFRVAKLVAQVRGERLACSDLGRQGAVSNERTERYCPRCQGRRPR
jgi:hypothetical protein